MRIAIVGNGEMETEDLIRVLGGRVALQQVSDREGMEATLRSGSVDVVACPWSGPCGNWPDVMTLVQRVRPGVPVIVLARAVSEKEWIKVLEAGGFDLLVPPYEFETTVNLLERAAASFQARETLKQPQKTGNA